MYLDEQLRRAAAAWAAYQFGDPIYRGYEFRGLVWNETGSEFTVYAFCANSPLHPLDMMRYSSSPNMPENPVYAKTTLGDHVTKAISGLKSLIDLAHNNPEAFRAIAATVKEEPKC